MEKYSSTKKMTEFEWAVLKENIRFRSTGDEPVIYVVDALGQVQEIGSVTPVHDMIANAPNVYAALSTRYQVLISQAEKDATGAAIPDYGQFMSILEKVSNVKPAIYRPYDFPQWLDRALGVVRKNYVESCDLILKGDIPYISNERGKCTYFYFDKDTKAGDFNLWDSYKMRFQSTEEWDYFKAWLWTVFDASTQNRQILYIHEAQGASGKTTMVNALCKFMGRAATTMSTSTLLSNFPLEHVIGRRFVSYPEIKLRNFGNLEIIKNITGGDEVSVTRKGKPTVREKVFAKIMMISNDPPEINSVDQSIASRLVVLRWRTNEEILAHPNLVEFLRKYVVFENDKPVVINSGFLYQDQYASPEKILAEQLPAFLDECRIAFEKSKHSSNEIAVPQSCLDALQNDCQTAEMEFLNYFFGSFCTFTHDHRIKRTDLIIGMGKVLKVSNYPTTIEKVGHLLNLFMDGLKKKHDHIEKFTRHNAVCFRGIEMHVDRIRETDGLSLHQIGAQGKDDADEDYFKTDAA